MQGVEPINEAECATLKRVGQVEVINLDGSKSKQGASSKDCEEILLLHPNDCTALNSSMSRLHPSVLFYWFPAGEFCTGAGGFFSGSRFVCHPILLSGFSQVASRSRFCYALSLAG